MCLSLKGPESLHNNSCQWGNAQNVRRPVCCLHLSTWGGDVPPSTEALAGLRVQKAITLLTPSWTLRNYHLCWRSTILLNTIIYQIWGNMVAIYQNSLHLLSDTIWHVITKQVLLLEENCIWIQSLISQQFLFTADKQSLELCFKHGCLSTLSYQIKLPYFVYEAMWFLSYACAPALGSHVRCLIVLKSNLSHSSLISPCLSKPRWFLSRCVRHRDSTVSFCTD